jgi:hypothetical protein
LIAIREAANMAVLGAYIGMGSAEIVECRAFGEVVF